MFRIGDIPIKFILGCGLALTTLISQGGAQPASKERVLYKFSGKSDGGIPVAGLTVDKAGNLYGTTEYGGICRPKAGCGTVFRLARDGTETVLHSFTLQRRDGAYPKANLIMDRTGNLYGTTVLGGEQKAGTVFKLASDGTETVLYSFGSNGAYPQAGLIVDSAGNLYGTTSLGGETGCSCGTVFKMAPDGTETVLYAFAGGSDGASPEAGLIADSAGNLYGTTAAGGGTGCSTNGCGTVFEVAPDGTETVLHAFAGGSDGSNPEAGLIADSAGNLYGTTAAGGGTGCSTGGCGTVFEVAPDGTETVLYAFAGGSDGSHPVAGLIADKRGNLYGTTSDRGGPGCSNGGGCGTVFEIKSQRPTAHRTG